MVHCKQLEKQRNFVDKMLYYFTIKRNSCIKEKGSLEFFVSRRRMIYLNVVLVGLNPKPSQLMGLLIGKG